EASELYLSLDPGLSELTEALYALLSHNRMVPLRAAHRRVA
ncbi:hypothetical protein MRX96_020578, partial [Rhipicephalus microplus]